MKPLWKLCFFIVLLWKCSHWNHLVTRNSLKKGRRLQNGGMLWIQACIQTLVQSYQLMLCLVAQSCTTLCDSDPMDYSPPGSSVMGILQTRILKWVAIPFSRGSSQPRDWTEVSRIAGRFFLPFEQLRKPYQLVAVGFYTKFLSSLGHSLLIYKIEVIVELWELSYHM